MPKIPKLTIDNLNLSINKSESLDYIDVAKRQDNNPKSLRRHYCHQRQWLPKRFSLSKPQMNSITPDDTRSLIHSILILFPNFTFT